MFSKIIKRYTYQRKPEPVSEGGFTPTLNFLKSCLARQVRDVDSVDKKTINLARNLVSGFTLIETIVAIIILLAVISFAFTISYNNTKHADLAKDQVVATFLVQDVFDYVIAQKKQNILGDDPSDWLDGFEDCQDNNGCSIDTSLALENAIRKCDGSGCKKLQQQTTGNFADIYGHSGEDTKFTRKVTIDEINQDNIEAVVTIDISWKSGFLTKNFSMSTNIFNTRY